MTALETFIAARTASGNMTTNVTITSPDALDVLFFVDPDGNGDGTPRMYTAHVTPLGTVQIRGGSPVELDTELRVVETPLGTGVEYELNRVINEPFDTPDFSRLMLDGSVNGAPRFISNRIEKYTETVADVGYNSIGTSGRDTLYGQGSDDVMRGKAGHDYMQAGSGDDTLYGGGGNDEMFGEAGHDEMRGNSGADRMYGGFGNDVILGGDGGDALYGGKGHDRMWGGNNNDGMFGGDGRDEMHGGKGGDNMHGGNGADVLHGNGGSDWLYGGVSNDILRGGSELDYLRGGNGKDMLFGGSGNDYLRGEAHDDTLSGGTGSDVFEFRSGDGSDVITDYEAGRDMIDLTEMGLTMEALVLSQEGSGVVIAAGTVEITLQDTNLVDLGADDFLF